MNPGNDPEIPSLKPLTGKEEEKKGGGIVPSSAKPAPSSGFKFPGFGGGSTGSKGFSAPNLKVRGLGGGGATVMDRLKNLRKKDLIFIAAGLCTLGMAPLAEHLLMSPEEQTAKLEEGFNRQQGPLFNDGGTVYEPGNGVGSPGGLVGSGSDVITPLNVRDPSNLIMSPGAQKKADAVVSAPPPTPGPAKGESDWKDVLRDSAKGGATKAVQQSGKLPRPNVKMAGAIRGLSALGGGGGGTGASLKLDPLSASNVPNRAAGSNALTRSQATPGFRGATARSGTSSGAGEDLRAAGQKQSDIFNKGGGASAALDAASREAIPSGGAGSGNGRPGNGDETKNPGGNSQKDNKSLGESLAFLRQKMEMEKSLDLKWERKKWNEFGRQKSIEEAGIKMGFDMFGKFAEKAFIEPLANAVSQAVAGGASPGGIQCVRAGRATPYTNGTGGRKYFCNAAGKGFSEDPKTGTVSDLGCDSCGTMAGGSGEATNPNAGNRDGSNPNQVQSPGTGPMGGTGLNLSQVCDVVRKSNTEGTSAIPAALKSNLLTAASKLVSARENMNRSGEGGCGGAVDNYLGQLGNPTAGANINDILSGQVIGSVTTAGSLKFHRREFAKRAQIAVGAARTARTKLEEASTKAVGPDGLGAETAAGVTAAYGSVTAGNEPLSGLAQRVEDAELKAKFDKDILTYDQELTANKERHVNVKAALEKVQAAIGEANGALGTAEGLVATVPASERERVGQYVKAVRMAHGQIAPEQTRLQQLSETVFPSHDKARLAYTDVKVLGGTVRSALGAPQGGEAYGAPVQSGADASVHQIVTREGVGIVPKLTEANTSPIKPRLDPATNPKPEDIETAKGELKTQYTTPVKARFEAGTKLLGNESPTGQAAKKAVESLKQILPGEAAAPGDTMTVTSQSGTI